jgi:hypothetical protein
LLCFTGAGFNPELADEAARSGDIRLLTPADLYTGILLPRSSLSARAVPAETEIRCPVMNLLLDMNVDLQIDWVRSGPDGPHPVPRDYITGAVREDFTCRGSLFSDGCHPDG